MARTIIRASMALLIAWIVYSAWAQEQIGYPVRPNGAARTQRVLVLYQVTGDHRGSELYATLTANLIGRFGKAEVQDVLRYRKGIADAYDAVFILPALQGVALPPELLRDLRNTKKPTVWIHHGIEQLFADAKYASAQPWAPGRPRRADFREVQYKGTRFPRDPRNTEVATEPQISDLQRARVYATAIGNDGRAIPWALRSGTLFYFVEAPFSYRHEDDRYLVFADLLFEVLAPKTPNRRRAMVRLEDVGPEANPIRIRQMADLFAAEGVPFSISVYDTYRDPLGRYNAGKPLTFSLRHRPQLVRALRYAVGKGGTLISHGHTHQTDVRPNPYNRVSGGDYEFFAADLSEDAFVLKGPLPGDQVRSWRRRFEKSRAAWMKARLPHPTIFTTPHYAGSVAAYKAMEQYAARYERVLYFADEQSAAPAYDGRWETQFFPYEVVDVRGDIILPENIGYSSSTERAVYFGRAAERLVASARRNLVVRDGFASFFHHWYEDPRSLRSTIRGIKQLGYQFVSPQQVIDAAPAHAPRRPRSVSPIALASSTWVTRLPQLSFARLVLLLGLIALMWSALELAYRRL